MSLPASSGDLPNLTEGLSMPRLAQIRLDELPPHNARIGHIVFGARRPYSKLNSGDFRAVATHGCAASLERLTIDEPHTQALAERVTHELQTPVARLLEFPGTDIFHLGSGNNGWVQGRLSELAILSMLWWGIANGKFDPGSFVFPATNRQDAGSKVNGFRTGYDQMLGTKRQLIPIQVKASPPFPDEVPYHPQIVEVMPRELFRHGQRSRTAARHLLEAFVEGNEHILSTANDLARRKIKAKYPNI